MNNKGFTQHHFHQTIYLNFKNVMKRNYFSINKYYDCESGAGFTIIEIIITIALLAFGIVGIYGFFYPASALTSNFSLHSTADYFAQEGLEVVKNIRDSNIIHRTTWSQGLSNCSAGCQLDYKTGTIVETFVNILQTYTGSPLNINSDGFYSYDAGTATKFKRKVTITRPFPSNSNILKVDVLVLWDYNGKSFSFDTIGYIYNLQ